MMIKKYRKRTKTLDGSMTRFIPFASTGTQMSNNIKKLIKDNQMAEYFQGNRRESSSTNLGHMHSAQLFAQEITFKQVDHEIKDNGTPVF